MDAALGVDAGVDDRFGKRFVGLGQIDVLADESNVGEKLEARDRHELVERALQKLPTAQRVPLVLYHLEGLRYEEIAEKLGVSLGKVKTDISRGREALRKKLRLTLELENNPI